MVQVVSSGSLNQRREANREVKTSNNERAPTWKTVLKVAKVVLIVVAVAAAIYLAGKYVIPTIVSMIPKIGGVVTAAGATAGAAAELATETASTATTAINTVTNTVKGIKKVVHAVDVLGNQPLVITGAKAVSTALSTAATNSLMIETSSGPVLNPGSMNQFVKNPFSGILKIIIGAFSNGKTENK